MEVELRALDGLRRLERRWEAAAFEERRRVAQDLEKRQLRQVQKHTA